jgi:hypothetical protein
VKNTGCEVHHYAVFFTIRLPSTPEKGMRNNEKEEEEIFFFNETGRQKILD